VLGPFAAVSVVLSHRQRSVVDSLRYWARQSDQGRTEVDIFAGWHAARCGWPYGKTK
jgi:hypothetical protein